MSSAAAPSLPSSEDAPEANSAVTSNSTSAVSPTDEPYYWEQGGDGTPNPVKLVTHNLHWITWQLLGGVEYVGEIFSDMFGMMNSRYEWAAAADRNRIVSD